MAGRENSFRDETNLHEIVEDELYSAQAKEICSDIRRFDDIMSGVIWALARNPKEFPIVLPEKGIRIVKTDQYSGIPAVRIFFKYDDTKVYLLWIEVIDTIEEGG